MTKAQLLDELGKKFYKVGVVEQAEDSEVGLAKRKEEGVAWYLVGVYEERNGVLIRRSIPIYVENEGKTDEAAFYGERTPQEHIIPEVPTNVFRGEVEAKIQAKITDGTIKKGIIENVSEKEEFATIKAYLEEAGEIVEKRYFVYKDTAGKIQISPMK